MKSTSMILTFDEQSQRSVGSVGPSAQYSGTEVLFQNNINSPTKLKDNVEKIITPKMPF
jgi:hypothetical protein